MALPPSGQVTIDHDIAWIQVPRPDSWSKAHGLHPKGAEEYARAKKRWIWAKDQVINIMRLRKRWAWLGQWMQQKKVKALVEGLERKGGKLIRTKNLSSELRGEPWA
jgi:hypothetical protein